MNGQRHGPAALTLGKKRGARWSGSRYGLEMSNITSPCWDSNPRPSRPSVAYPGIFFVGGSTNSVEDRGQGSGGGSPLVRGSGGSCNLLQEISFHTVKFS